VSPEEIKAALKDVFGPAAARIGSATARRAFEPRGNHSEIHLSELELASWVAAGVDAYIQTREAK
jgi:hypothetical protein